MAPQRHAQVRYLSSPRMGNYPLPRPGEPHTFARQKRARDAPGRSRGGQREAERRVGPDWFLGFFAPPAPDRPSAPLGSPSLGSAAVGGREPEGRSKGTRAKSWKRSRRGGDEDSQTSQKERAGAGEMRIGVWFEFVSFCHNISELRERAVIEHERQNEYPSFQRITQRIAMEIILPQRTNIKGRSHRLTWGASRSYSG